MTQSRRPEMGEGTGGWHGRRPEPGLMTQSRRPEMGEGTGGWRGPVSRQSQEDRRWERAQVAGAAFRCHDRVKKTGDGRGRRWLARPDTTHAHGHSTDQGDRVIRSQATSAVRPTKYCPPCHKASPAACARRDPGVYLRIQELQSNITELATAHNRYPVEQRQSYDLHTP
ncbi:unnamed protein product [Schistocephalus solidus]|uniref:Uncharacterized protein n=1 Tax=Schistocephalus solidus TaxID=70667 RepID=A0A183T9G8_SCHSO|nr:unnamed protein product [Schistocephalus solidus]